MHIPGKRPLSYLGLWFVCLGTAFASRQSLHPNSTLPLPPVKTLSPYSSSLSDVPSFGQFGPTQCDLNSNLYFHLDNGSYNSGVIMRLERGSWKPHLFKIPSELAKDASFFEFSVTPLGKTRSLVEKTDGQYHVISFDSDTDNIDDTQLQIPDHLVLTDFIASEAGTLLIGGYFDEKAPKDTQGKSFLALLQPSGRILKDFTVEGPGPVELANVRMKHHDGAGTVGPDGNFYFVSGHVMLVISAYGDLVKRTPIATPEEQGTHASSLTIAGDLISIQFSKSDKDGMIHQQYLVLSLSTGSAYGLYVPAEELGNNCVCFSTRSGYTFLRVENGKLKFVNAPLS